jgi:hypothetical protein
MKGIPEMVRYASISMCSPVEKIVEEIGTRKIVQINGG